MWHKHGKIYILYILTGFIHTRKAILNRSLFFSPRSVCTEDPNTLMGILSHRVVTTEVMIKYQKKGDTDILNVLNLVAGDKYAVKQ